MSFLSVGNATLRPWFTLKFKVVFVPYAFLYVVELLILEFFFIQVIFSTTHIFVLLEKKLPKGVSLCI